MSSRSGVLLAALALLAPCCKGNVNDDGVLISVTDRVSVNALGVEGNFAALGPSISSDGRYVAFHSQATNLLPGVTSGASQVYRKDTLTGGLELVSVGTSGAPATGDSTNPSISADGRYVAFQSTASDLVGGDTNGTSDVFVRDLQLLTTIRVSVKSGGAESTLYAIGLGNSDAVISADGQHVAFRSDSNDLSSVPILFTFNIYRHHVASVTTEIVSVNPLGAEPAGDSGNPSISSDGTFVAFDSTATDLLLAGPTGPVTHVFVRDMSLSPGAPNAMEICSVSTAGVQGDTLSQRPSISGDGNRVVFSSTASNLAPETTLTYSDIFLRDRGAGTTTIVSRSTSGVQGIGDSASPSLSADGRYIVFTAQAANLVPTDTNGAPDVFWHDTATGATLRASVGTYGAQAIGQTASTSRAVISADGRFAAFESDAYNLVAADGNTVQDIFIHGPLY